MKVITSRKIAITSALLIARNNAGHLVSANRLGTNKSSNTFVPSAAMEKERILLQNFDMGMLTEGADLTALVQGAIDQSAGNAPDPTHHDYDYDLYKKKCFTVLHLLNFHHPGYDIVEKYGWLCGGDKGEDEDEVITSAPTAKATTSNPSPSTSVTPTKVPTDQPTPELPTSAPSEQPTKKPSSGPSVTPTKVPTEGPSVTPTKVPTDRPTKEPSLAPTGVPLPLCNTTCCDGLNCVTVHNITCFDTCCDDSEESNNVTTCGESCVLIPEPTLPYCDTSCCNEDNCFTGAIFNPCIDTCCSYYPPLACNPPFVTGVGCELEPGPDGYGNGNGNPYLRN